MINKHEIMIIYLRHIANCQPNITQKAKLISNVQRQPQKCYIRA